MEDQEPDPLAASPRQAVGEYPCRFCASGGVYAVMVSPAGNALMHCASCGGYWFPRTADLSAYYNDEYVKVHRRQYVNDHKAEYDSGAYDAILDTLEHHLNPSPGRLRRRGGKRRIMDFGSHYAFLLKRASERGMEAVSVEYDEAVAEYNRKELGIETIKPSDLGGVPDGTLDIVYASHVVEHLLDPASTLQEIACKLRDGGILAMTSPCFSGDIVGSDTLRITDMVYPEHLSFFTLEGARKIMERAGLNVTEAASQFVDDTQALRHLGEGVTGEASGALREALEGAPFHAGSNLFVVGRKTSRQTGVRKTEVRDVAVTSPCGTRGIHRVLGDGRAYIPFKSELPACVSGNALVLATPGVSPPVTIGLDGCDETLEIPPNSGPRSFVLTGSSKGLTIRGGKDTEVFVYDLVVTADATGSL